MLGDIHDSFSMCMYFLGCVLPVGDSLCQSASMFLFSSHCIHPSVLSDPDAWTGTLARLPMHSHDSHNTASRARGTAC